MFLKFRRFCESQSLGKRVAVFLLLTAAVLLILIPILFWDALNFDRLRREVLYGKKTAQISFESNKSNALTVCAQTLVVASNSAVKIYPSNGGEPAENSWTISSPAVQSRKDYAIAFDFGGTAFAGIRPKSRRIVSAEASGPILDADLSERGYICTATLDSGSKTVLRLYDEELREIYHWYSSSRFLPQCALSPNAMTIAATSYGEQDGDFAAFLQILRTDSGDPGITVPVSDGMVYDLRFFGNNTVCLISSDGVHTFRKDGELLGEWKFDGELQAFSLSSDRFLAVVLSAYDMPTGCKIVTLDREANVLASLAFPRPVESLHASGNYLSLLSDGELSIYRKDLSLYDRIPAREGTESVFANEDGSVFTVSRSVAERVLPQ